ncbi:putative heme binding protein, partial [Trypoxylus dichotomus]
KGMFNLMLDVSKLYDAYIGKHVDTRKVLDVKDCISRVSSDIIGTCAFGINCNSLNDATFHIVLKDIMAKANNSLKMSFYNALPKLARFLRVQIFPKKETRFLCKSIDETIADRARNGIERNDFLQLAIKMKNDNIINMNELRAQCNLFLNAGYETTRNAIKFFLFEIACNQNIQQKLRDEINEILTEYGGEMTYEALGKMKYLDMVINETLRKYPPIAFLNRKCVKDFKLPDSDMLIEKDTRLIISNYGLQHDPEYFPNPDKFDPERFSDANKNKILPYTYLPFGEGPRNCIGDRFAKMEMKVTAVCFVKKYKLMLHKMLKMPLKLDRTGLFIDIADDILFDLQEISE